MKEDFLHFVWLHRLFDLSDLRTTSGEEITLLNTGVHNLSSGPDFTEARLKLGNTLWVGTVEIHLRSSDWFAHQHQHDVAYHNVILHVVYENDRLVHGPDGNPIPTLELKGRIRRSVVLNYERLQGENKSIPCSSFIRDITTLTLRSWLDRLVVQRLERKSQDVRLLLNNSSNDWMQTYYAMLAAYVGGNLNKLPMLELARRVPFRLIARYKGHPERLTALLLGVAGLLHPEKSLSEQQMELLKEYAFLKKKHGLSQVSQHWKTGRLRPDQAPVNRVVQFAGMVHAVEEAFESLTSHGSYDWTEVTLQYPTFWEQHNSFTNERKKRSNHLTSAMADLIAINVHAPVVYQYSLYTGDDILRENLADALHQIAPESNSTVRSWGELGIKPETAAESQALLELKSQFCNLKKCVNCSIGKTIISRA